MLIGDADLLVQAGPSRDSDPANCEALMSSEGTKPAPSLAPAATHAFDPMGLPESLKDLEALSTLVEQEGIRLGRKPVVVEIGTWAGRSAIVMAEHAQAVHCIDHWMGNPHDCLGPIAEKIGKQKAFLTFCRNCGDLLFEKIFPYYGDSLEWARMWRLEADIVFVDASHEHESVRRDILAWKPHVRPGGILCGHDFCRLFPGVVQAVRELFPTGGEIVGQSIWTCRV
jgi:SAM-dependent methyltransferase